MKASTKTDYKKRIETVLHHIEGNLDGSLEPTAIAKVGAMSLHHFHRVFKGQTGESLMQCIRRLRLERAARELRFGQTTVLQTALDAGYQSHEAFLRAFRRQFGCKPSEFREHLHRAIRTERLSTAQIEVRREPSVCVLMSRHMGPYLSVSAHWEKFMQSVFELELPIKLEKGEPETFAWVHDDPEVTAPERLRYDACVELTSTDFALPEDSAFRVATIEGGLYAIALHEGSYDSLSETYVDLIGCWFPQNQRALRPVPIVERYLNLPLTTKASELKTEIWVQIAELD